MTKHFAKCVLCLFSFTFVLLTTQTTFAQTEKLGIVKYTPPPGWNKTQLQPNVIQFSTLNQTTGAFCIITLYGATPSTGSPQTDFAREWADHVVKTLDKAEANPSIETTVSDGWTVLAAGSAVETQVGKGAAFLTVISGSGKEVSILAVFSDAGFVKQIDAFIKGIDLDKATVPVGRATPTSAPALDSDGNLVIPQPTRQLTIADLVGEWGDNPGRIATTYVDRSDGSYVGTDSLHFTSKWTIDASGRYTNDFFEVRNGKKLSDVTTGSITIVGRLISIKHGRSTAKYVVRGWLELSNMTILKVAGPWYDEQEIPERIFTDFSPDSRFILTAKWVRKR